MKDKRILLQHWRWEKLGNLFTVDKKQIDSSNPSFVNLPFLGLENIESHTRQYISSETSQDTGESTCFLFDNSHVLYGKLRPYLNKVYLPEQKGRCSMELLPLKPSAGYSRSFVALILQSELVINYTIKHSTGGRMPRADINKLVNLRVPIPIKVEERNEIVGRLEHKISEIEKMRQAALRQKEAVEAMQGAILRKVFYFQEGGKLPQGWKWAKTIDVLDHSLKSPIRMGPFGSQLTKDELVSDGVFVLGIEHVLNKKFDDTGNKFINDEKFKRLRGFEVKPGDVLITMMGTIGRTAVVPEGVRPTIISSHLLKMTLRKDVYPDYIAWVLSNLSPVYRQVHAESQGAIMQGLNTGIIKKLSFPLPSQFDEQLAIVRTLERQMTDVEKMHQATNRQLEAIEAMPAAMLREVFDFDAETGAAN